MKPLARLMALRTGGGTERCHGIRHAGSYSVAAHTWGVLALLHQLWPEDFGRLAAVVTFHDLPEAWIGDIPAPTKRYNAAVKAACDAMDRKILDRLGLPSDQDLEPGDARKVKACDQLELYLWAREQVHAGNLHASCVVRELERYFRETPLPGAAEVLYLEIKHGSVEHATDRLIMEING
jgi:5'-deoxynucleotidase YfbR-like HD superfamily hydrolase